MNYIITWLDDKWLYKAEYKWYDHKIILLNPIQLRKKKKKIGKWNFRDIFKLQT